MSIPKLVGRLRRFRLWSTVRLVIRAFGSPIARFLHSPILRLGPGVISENLWLKHSYDYTTLYVDPGSITRQVHIGGWRKGLESKSILSRVKAWYQYGDGLKSVRTHPTRNIHGKFIADGDWDLRGKPFTELPVIAQLFEEGRSPRQTDEYQRYLSRIEDGQLTWTRGCRNEGELDRYYDELVSAYRDIRDNGYRTQTELGETGVDEIRVCIDRDGNICVFGGGTHRLSIARFLNLDVVPVSLKRIHASWIDTIAQDGFGIDEAGIEHAVVSAGLLVEPPQSKKSQ